MQDHPSNVEGDQDCGQELAREGLRRLAASAALIKASLEGPDGFESGLVESPELRIRADGEFEAWLGGGSAPIDMFKAWPNKFGRLAFGFACDHFKMLHGAYFEELRQQACARGAAVVASIPQPFGVNPQMGLEDARPERMTAPALMALCQRMASSPGWLMGALDDLEKGRAPSPPKRAPKKGFP